MDYNKFITEQTQGVAYGQVQLNIKVHRGLISKAEATKNINVKIDSQNPEADAAAIIISAMKQHQLEAGKNESSLGFVITYRHNKPSVVQVQNFISQGV